MIYLEHYPILVVSMPFALSKLNMYFTPIVNVSYTRHVFRQMKQNEGETILQFVTRLRIVANDCDYGNNRNDFVKDLVIENVSKNHFV